MASATASSTSRGNAPSRKCVDKNSAVAARFTSATRRDTKTRGCLSSSSRASSALFSKTLKLASAALAMSALGLFASDIFFCNARTPFQPTPGFFGDSGTSVSGTSREESKVSDAEARRRLSFSFSFSFSGFRGARAASASRWSPPAHRSAREAMSTTVGTVVMAVRLCPLFVRGATPAKGVPSGPLEANEDSAKHERAPIVCAYSP
mmetsp:Transcript_5456/g.23094  ORF Transcript_5456/g.23094 Transcript_5456/m.23094 type:complete len:207 (-) Transcript_5456:91-711(-)